MHRAERDRTGAIRPLRRPSVFFVAGQGHSPCGVVACPCREHGLGWAAWLLCVRMFLNWRTAVPANALSRGRRGKDPP
eukprot:740017-Alexandrium_andersonii.AAC.1